MAQVELENVSKRFGQVPAVDDLSLRVEDRELLVLVGPSGCGKSTTLRLIAGLEELDAGTIRIGEQVINRVQPRHRNIAMVFQNYALYPHMNVYKNMAFGLKMRRVPRREIDERVRRAAGILGIEELLERKPAQLSGGQRQRVAVGRAIVRDPDVFLFDEPLSNLDAKLRVSMRTELVKLHQQLQTTSIHVTHDQVEAMMMGHRIVVMHHGKIQQLGKPLEVYNSPANRFVAEFVGSPPMNFLEGVLKADGEALNFHADSLTLPVPPDRRERLNRQPDGRVTLGVRPEHLLCVPPNGRPGLWTGAAARVLVVQPIGAESILDVACGAGELVVKADSQNGPAPDAAIDLYFDMSRAHWFDSQSGAVL